MWCSARVARPLSSTSTLTSWPKSASTGSSADTDRAVRNRHSRRETPVNCMAYRARTSGVSLPGSQLMPTNRTSRSEEHTSELQSHSDLVCRLLLEKKNHGPPTPGQICQQTPQPQVDGAEGCSSRDGQQQIRHL